MLYDPTRYDDSSIKLDGLTTRIHALLYADDSSMISKTASEISERLTRFEKACLDQADMVISHPKTFCMPVCKKIRVDSTQSSEFLEHADKLAFGCRCGMRFSSKTGLKQHDSLLYYKEKYNKHVYGFKEGGEEAKYEVDKIIDTRGNEITQNRVYMVLWREVLPGREDRKMDDFDPKDEFEVEKSCGWSKQ